MAPTETGTADCATAGGMQGLLAKLDAGTHRVSLRPGERTDGSHPTRSAAKPNHRKTEFITRPDGAALLWELFVSLSFIESSPPQIACFSPLEERSWCCL